MDWLLETGRPDAPNNGKRVLEAMHRGPNGIGEPGSPARQRRIQMCKAFLRFAVEECGIDSRWSPPRESVVNRIIGLKAPNAELARNEGQAVALTDEQFVRLFDSIKDQRWRMAVGLLGQFGIRGVELNYLSPRDNGLHIADEKRNSNGSTKPRVVPILDPKGRQGLGRKLLLMLQTGLVPMPPLGKSDSQAAISVNQALMRSPVWRELKEEAKAVGKRVSVYSLRHCFADRCGMRTPAIPPKAAAAAMGNSLPTHLQIDQANYHQKDVMEAFERANSVV